MQPGDHVRTQQIAAAKRYPRDSWVFVTPGGTPVQLLAHLWGQTFQGICLCCDDSAYYYQFKDIAGPARDLALALAADSDDYKVRAWVAEQMTPALRNGKER